MNFVCLKNYQRYSRSWSIKIHDYFFKKLCCFMIIFVYNEICKSQNCFESGVNCKRFSLRKCKFYRAWCTPDRFEFSKWALNVLFCRIPIFLKQRSTYVSFRGHSAKIFGVSVGTRSHSIRIILLILNSRKKKKMNFPLLFNNIIKNNGRDKWYYIT